jgi:hypothetical protein
LFIGLPTRQPEKQKSAGFSISRSLLMLNCAIIHPFLLAMYAIMPAKKRGVIWMKKI